MDPAAQPWGLMLRIVVLYVAVGPLMRPCNVLPLHSQPYNRWTAPRQGTNCSTNLALHSRCQPRHYGVQGTRTSVIIPCPTHQAHHSP